VRVLVVGTMPDVIDRAAAELIAVGHEVVRCHESGELPFPCAALIEGRECPLEHGPADVVVTAREHPWPRPSPYEAGVVCGLRRHVPLVAVDAAVNPFRRWTARDVEGGESLAAACEEVAEAPMPTHSDVATKAARDVVVTAGLDPSGTEATVRRRRGALKVTVDLPKGSADLSGTVAARVIAALQAFDRHAAGIDISPRASSA